VLARFALPAEPTTVEPWPGGHINDSWRVTCGRGDDAPSFLLQRLNPAVFSDAAAVMHNIAAVTTHAARRLRAEGVEDRRRMLALVAADDGAPWVTHESAGWRVYEFVMGATVHETADSPTAVREIARGFGRFLRLMSDYAGPPLRETIPGFHDTGARFARLEATLRSDRADRYAGTRADVDALMAERPLADVLPPLLAAGLVPSRIVHNDAKPSNVLLDAGSGDALCVIDLDTVMPGTALSDFGDLVRAMASDAAEDERDIERIAVQPQRFAALVEGWLDEAGTDLTGAEREHLVFAGRLITLEQAVRFLTDHLDGDAYYRIAYPGHNLVRARAQLALFRSLTARAAELEAMVSRATAARASATDRPH